jgi:hypothetical protein
VVHWDVPFAAGKDGLLLIAFDPNPDASYYYLQQVH